MRQATAPVATVRQSPPFASPTLQQEAAHRFGVGVGETLGGACRFYEGVHHSGETAGIITYILTYVMAMATTAATRALAMIRGRFRDVWVPARLRVYRCRSRKVREASKQRAETVTSTRGR